MPGEPRIAEPIARGADASVLMARLIVWRVFRDAAFSAGDYETAEALHVRVTNAECLLWLEELEAGLAKKSAEKQGGAE